MPAIPHTEKHFTSSEAVRDIVIGMSDGLTVPFALAAGLSGAVNSTGVIVVAGLAEIAAGCIAMGLGGFLAARTDEEHYQAEKKREEREVLELTAREEQEVVDIFAEYGLDRPQVEPVLERFRANHGMWVDFMLRFELGMEKPDPRRALSSALTIGGAYLVGGMIPLFPYMIDRQVGSALILSSIATLLALCFFGWIKARYTGINPLKGAAQTVLVGGLAAAVAYAVARLIG
jgi:VIT1/CCC1 family predicted Fe2+/Mn2+ transporter